MLSMVNVNRFLNTVLIPSVIATYGVFLLIDHAHNNNRDRAPQSIEKIGTIDGLLFGGSNVEYSLSAEFLSYYMGIKWFNAAVEGELLTIKRHKNFIQDLSARIDRTKVRYVVYSSVAPYTTGVIVASKQNLGIGIKPKTSALGYIRHLAFRDSGSTQHNTRNRFGDAVFENGDCNFTAEYVGKQHQREDEDISAEFLVDYAIFFASLFPNASILIVLPSEYYGALSL